MNLDNFLALNIGGASAPKPPASAAYGCDMDSHTVNAKFSPIPTYTVEEDFSIVIKILEFHLGDKYIDVNISIINDESIEGNETFTIYLTSDVGVNVSPYAQTEVTIIDEDYNDGKKEVYTWTLCLIS